MASDTSKIEPVDADVTQDSCENKALQSLDEAKKETSARAKYLFTLHDANLEEIVSLKTRDIVWKIVSSFDDWKPWQYEISYVLNEEKYPENAIILLERCLKAISDNGTADEGLYKLARNLLSSLVEFSAVNAQFKKAANDNDATKVVLDFLAKTERLIKQAGKQQILLIKTCLYIPLILGYYPSSTIQQTAKILPSFIEINDVECKCLALLWLSQLLDRDRTLPVPDITNDFSILTNFLKLCLENGDKDFVSWLVGAIFTYATRSPDCMAKISQQPDVKSSLVWVVENCWNYSSSCLIQARKLLQELSPESSEKWQMVTFKTNRELATAEAARDENTVRIAFLKKLYDASPYNLVSLDAVNAFNLLLQSRALFKHPSEEWTIAFENVLAQENFAEIAVKYTEVLAKRDLDKEELTNEIMQAIFRIMWTACDASETLRIKAIDAGFVDLLLDNLKDIEGVTMKCTRSERFNFILVSATISILYNISRSSQLKQKFLERDAANTLVHYIDDKYRKVVQVSLFIAYVLSDTPEAARLADEQGVIKIITDMANDAMQQEDRHARTSSGVTWSLSELLDGLCVLAKNDYNKVKLMENNVCNLVKELLLNGESTEKVRGIDLLWTLCFDTTVRNEIMANYSEDIIKPLDDLTRSENVTVQNAAKQVFAFIEKWNDIEEAKANDTLMTLSLKVNEGKTETGHVFLSYSWKQQETVLRIRQELLNRKYKIWMDVDKMHGGLLEAMAKAVEDASVVLLCFSSSYKESNPCRAEAQYAYSLGKKIVPINMEYRYQADGWLGILVRPLLYIDMSLEQKPFEASIEELFKEIHNALGAEVPVPAAKSEKDKVIEEGRTHGSIVSSYGKSSRATSFASTSKTPANKPKYAQWTNLEVAKWLQKEQLHLVFGSKLKRFDGEKLWALLKMRDKAPEFFYQALKDYVGTSLPDLLDLLAAFDRLVIDES